MEQTKQQFQERYAQLEQEVHAALIEKIKKENKQSQFNNYLCLDISYLNEDYVELAYTNRPGTDLLILISEEGFEYCLDRITLQELINFI